ncbi:uncharacterized protein I206_104911 [Kwoniella pini CBS 10737]|uniref:Uncharacterized protein n=1 Tax=Kwoniella pini CBS 10737 TaxID=1296096 RepID=A0A1B9I8B4_9TREE|nr:uncharacterized protein I206_02451 [Kwoniella pini CBS 10737]OCF51736.1 hypothetical protein I206_02451 [Kwoniella pini CBS 10737]
MSINSIKLGQGQNIPLKLGEELLTPGNTVEVELKVPATIQGPKRIETAKGKIWITDQRVIFIANSIDNPGPSTITSSQPNPPKYDSPPILSSIEIPYLVMKFVNYNLPTFSANHILIKFIPIENNNSLPNPGIGQFIELKLWIGEGLGHSIWKRIEGEKNKQEEKFKNLQEETLR